MPGPQLSDRAVVTAFDEGYLMPGIVAMATALRHAPPNTDGYVLGVDLSAEARRMIESSVGPGGVRVLEAGEFAREMPAQGHISSAAWGRIGLGSLLPESITRAVYVDADTFTRGDLAPLFALDLDGRVLAAAIERPMPTHRHRHLWGETVEHQHTYSSDCSVPGSLSYFNSGLLSIDLARWRFDDVERRLLDFASTMPASFLLLDQDVMNSVLWREWSLIDWELWNWPGYFKQDLAWDARVVHFVGPAKPWVSYPLGAPFVREYRSIASGLGWDMSPTRQRVRSGLIESVAPNGLVMRRKRIAAKLNHLLGRAN
jgi:lipopolysaccharide biosynthesis glycosyltransferase